ncbi:MAG: hypothetical protein ACUVRD_00620 [Bacteroidia bacterium]
MRNFLWLAGLAALVLWGCKKKKEESQNAGDNDHMHGAVTTIKLKLMMDTGDSITAFYKDPDGPGGRSPEFDTLKVKAGMHYHMHVELLDESKSPSQDLTEEIFEEEKDYHRLFIHVHPDSLAQLEVMDRDSRQRPVGGHWDYRASSTVLEGKLHFILKHYLNADDKDRGMEAGSTDIDATIPVKAQP